MTEGRDEAQGMSEPQCWRVIEAAGRAGGGDLERQVWHIVRLVSSRPLGDIVRFSSWVRQKMLDACEGDVLLGCLWVATAEDLGDLSGDGWEYWRGWMVSRGRREFESILDNPDVLADLVRDPWELFSGESVEYSGVYAYYAATGGQPDLEVGDYAYRPARGVEAPEAMLEPSVIETWPDRSGWRGLTREALITRFPKLHKRFGPPAFIDAYLELT